MKLTPDEVKNLSPFGREGLLKEMIEVHDWRFVTGYKIRETNKVRDGGMTSRYLKELYEEGRVERVPVREPGYMYRPDAVARDHSVFINYLSDRLTFLRETRRRFRITCPDCGDSYPVLLRQLPTRILPCLKCGCHPRVAEYPPLMEDPR